jgi:hypothetical protein
VASATFLQGRNQRHKKATVECFAVAGDICALTIPRARAFRYNLVIHAGMSHLFATGAILWSRWNSTRLFAPTKSDILTLPHQTGPVELWREVSNHSSTFLYYGIHKHCCFSMQLFVRSHSDTKGSVLAAKRFPFIHSVDCLLFPKGAVCFLLERSEGWPDSRVLLTTNETKTARHKFTRTFKPV